MAWEFNSDDTDLQGYSWAYYTACQWIQEGNWREMQMSRCSLPVAVRSLSRVYFLQLLHYLVVLDHGFGWFSKDNGLLWWLSGKESACQCRRPMKCRINPWVEIISCRRKWQPILVFLPGKFHGQKSLAGSQRVGHTDHTNRSSLSPV